MALTLNGSTGITGAGIGTIGPSGANITGIVTATSFNGGQLGNRNIIHNGAFQIAQRGTSYTGTDDYGTVDRWRTSKTGLDENLTQSQHALTSSDTGPWAEGFRYSWHIQNGNQTSGAAADHRVYLQSRVEAQDMATCGWDYTSAASNITFSFWVKSSVAQNFYGFIRAADGTSQRYAFETGSLSADTWKKVTKVIPGASNVAFDMNNDVGLYVYIIPFQGTDYTDSGVSLNTWGNYATGTRTPDNTTTWYTTNDATFEITGVQLEVGSHPTPFEHRSYGDELLRCQRYYCQTYSSGADIGAASKNDGALCDSSQAATTYATCGQFHFPVSMRATPTCKLYSANSGTINKISADTTDGTATVTFITNERCFPVRSNDSSGVTANAFLKGHITADAEL